MKAVCAGVAAIVLGTALSAQENSVSCRVLNNDGVEKIQCTLWTSDREEAREGYFYWHSEAHPQDDREHAITIPPKNRSIYDYRLLRGRAQGKWTVTVTMTEGDGKVKETSCSFSLKDTTIVDKKK